MVRSFYSGPCRWYAGGPVGRIRYYRASPHAQVLPGLNVFWPITELLSEESNTAGPGETIPPPRRSYHKGQNYRPELDGSAPDGSADDFAGRTPAPAVQPDEPACVAGDGLRALVQVQAVALAGAGDFAPAGLTLRFDDEPDLPDLWLRPEELAGLAVGQSIAVWPRTPGTLRDGNGSVAFPALQPTVSEDDGRRGGSFTESFFGGVQFLNFTQIDAAAWTLFLVGRVLGPTADGPSLRGPNQTDVGLNPTVFQVRSNTGIVFNWFPPGSLLGVLTVWKVERGGGLVRLWANGELLQSQPDPDPTIPDNFSAWKPTAVFSTNAAAWMPEVLLYARALADEEQAAAWAYLLNRYPVEDNDVLPGSLIPFAGPALPAGYLACDGSAVNRTTFAALFAVIGTSWGPGDGSTTFNLPDLRGRSPLGTSPGGLGADRPTARALAAAGGEESHVLTQPELPNVNFGVVDSGHQHGTQSGANFDGENGNTGGTSAGNPGGDSGANETNVAATGIGVQSGGTDTPHNTMHPFAVVQWVIKT